MVFSLHDVSGWLERRDHRAWLMALDPRSAIGDDDWGVGRGSGAAASSNLMEMGRGLPKIWMDPMRPLFIDHSQPTPAPVGFWPTTQCAGLFRRAHRSFVAFPDGEPEVHFAWKRLRVPLGWLAKIDIGGEGGQDHQLWINPMRPSRQGQNRGGRRKNGMNPMHPSFGRFLSRSSRSRGQREPGSRATLKQIPALDFVCAGQRPDTGAGMSGERWRPVSQKGRAAITTRRRGGAGEF